jgi:hypothetical protein
LLPNNSAWATRMPYKDKENELQPYTNCTAINNGWVWNIPLWSRIGTGYVYSDKFVDDETALKEFQQYLGTDELEFKNIKMRVGIHKRLWVKNVVAVGLSAGFIEPLESNGLFSVHEFLHHLVRNLQRDKVSQFDKDNYSYVCRQVFDTFAEFVALHYALSHRDDTEYWRANLNKQWSTSLIDRYPVLQIGIDEVVRQRGFDFHYSSGTGFHCIAAGMNWSPTDVPSLIKVNYNNDMNYWNSVFKTCADNLDKKKNMWKESVKDMESLYEFLKNNFYKDSA